MFLRAEHLDVALRSQSAQSGAVSSGVGDMAARSMGWMRTLLPDEAEVSSLRLIRWCGRPFCT